MTTTPAGRPLAYKLREVAAVTPWGYEKLLQFVHAGLLPARRRQDAAGNPVGPFLIRHEDLVAFVDEMPVA